MPKDDSDETEAVDPESDASQEGLDAAQIAAMPIRNYGKRSL